ncbi:TRAP transporter small permease subunit [Fretibacter rubidus]|uniref:TRAP transporter small permease subunit n=1 Tax=Fretibacter rubidus TaxID=570162 RepID=UPI00352B86F7
MSAAVDIAASALKGIGWAALPLLLLPAVYIVVPGLRGLKAFCDAIIKLIDDVSYGVGEVIKWALPLLVLSVAFGVFALSIFGVSWTKLFESATYFHASVIMLGSAATLLAGQHVRVDVFHDTMSQHKRAWVDFIGFYALLAPVCLIILWDSQSFVNFAWRIFEGSNEADGIKGVFLLKTLIPIFALMMTAQALAIALRAAMCLNGDTRPTRPPGIAKLFAPDDEPHEGISHSEAGL